MLFVTWCILAASRSGRGGQEGLLCCEHLFRTSDFSREHLAAGDATGALCRQKLSTWEQTSLWFFTLQMPTVLRALKIPRAVQGKEPPGVIPLPTHQPFSSDSAQMYRLLGVFVRVLLKSLRITPSCRLSASRTSRGQCRGALRADPTGAGGSLLLPSYSLC